MRRELRRGKDRYGVGDRLKMPRRQKEIRKVTIGEAAVSLPEIIAVAQHEALVVMSEKVAFRRRLEDRPRLAFLVAELRRLAEPTYEDRPMDCDIEALAGRISAAGIPGEG
jgi:hypothetical protein